MPQPEGGRAAGTRARSAAAAVHVVESGPRLFIPAGTAHGHWVRPRARRGVPPDLPRFRVAWTPSTTLERRTTHKHAGRPTPAPESGGLTPVGAEKSALTGSERGFQGLRAAACSFSRILQPVTHPPGSVSRETRLQVNLARRSTPAAAARRSGGHLQELHFLRRGRCPPQLALAGLAHTRIFEAEAGEGDRRR